MSMDERVTNSEGATSILLRGVWCWEQSWIYGRVSEFQFLTVGLADCDRSGDRGDAARFLVRCARKFAKLDSPEAWDWKRRGERSENWGEESGDPTRSGRVRSRNGGQSPG